MAVYKISYVITGKAHPGAILNTETRPEVGDIVQLGNESFEVLEVLDLMPARGNFHFLHVTCKPVSPEKKSSA